MQRPGSRIKNPQRGNLNQPVLSALNFTPLHFAPSLWLDAADTSTITSVSQGVSEWRDKSGNARHFSQANSLTRPLTANRFVNNLNTIDFNGVDDRLFRTSISLVHPTLGTYTAFAVVLPDIVSSQHQILNGDDDPIRTPQFLRFSTNNLESIRIQDLSGTINTVTATLSATAGVAVLVASRLDTATLQVFSDGRSSTPLTATNGASTALAMHDIGSYNTLTGFFNGLICEVIAYPYALTNGQLQVVQNYLRTKWRTPL